MTDKYLKLFTVPGIEYTNIHNKLQWWNSLIYPNLKYPKHKSIQCDAKNIYYVQKIKFNRKNVFFRMYFNSNDHVMTDLLWCHWLRSPWLPCTEWTANWCCGPPPLRYPSGVAGTSLWIWREPHHWSPLGRPCWPYNHWQWPLEEGLAMKKIKFYLQYPTSFDTTKFSCSFSYFFKNMFEIKVKS